MPNWPLLGSYRVVQPAKAILDSVKNGNADSQRVTYLAQDPKLSLGPVEGGAAVVSSYRLNDVTVDVDTPGPALLRLADAWYPDWTARVDGKTAPLYPADYLLRAVPVPAGKHRVEFRFASKAVRDGLILSLGSLAVVLALLGAGAWSGRRRAAAPGHPAPGAAPPGVPAGTGA